MPCESLWPEHEAFIGRGLLWNALDHIACNKPALARLSAHLLTCATWYVYTTDVAPAAGRRQLLVQVRDVKADGARPRSGSQGLRNLMYGGSCQPVG